MPAYDFSAMSPDDIAYTILMAENPADVEPLFESLYALDQELVLDVADMINYEGAAMVQSMASTITRASWFSDILHVNLNSAILKTSPEQLAALQAGVDVLGRVVDILGEEAHPLTVAYVAEARKLSEEDYNSPQLMLAAVAAVRDVQKGTVPPIEARPQPEEQTKLVYKTLGQTGKRHFKI